jgi:hypothetical protein
MSKPALLIGLDGAVQVMAVPKTGDAMPSVVRVPVPRMLGRDMEIPYRRLDRTFRLQGELRTYWIYEEDW